MATELKPRIAIFKSSLCYTDKLLLLAIYEHCDWETAANGYPTIARLRQYTSFGKSTVLRRIIELKKIGVLDWISGWKKGRVASRYSINIERLVELFEDDVPEQLEMSHSGTSEESCDVPERDMTCPAARNEMSHSGTPPIIDLPETNQRGDQTVAAMSHSGTSESKPIPPLPNVPLKPIPVNPNPDREELVAKIIRAHPYGREKNIQAPHIPRAYGDAVIEAAEAEVATSGGTLDDALAYLLEATDGFFAELPAGKGRPPGIEKFFRHFDYRGSPAKYRDFPTNSERKAVQNDEQGKRLERKLAERQRARSADDAPAIGAQARR